MRAKRLETNSGSFNYEEPTVVSPAISLANTNTTTQAVWVPDGAYVTKVALLATSAVANVTVDVGDGSETDVYIDGLTTLGANKIAVAPVPGSAVGSDETGGKYYSSADSIDVKELTTGSADTATGTVKLLVWYYV